MIIPVALAIVAFFLILQGQINQLSARVKALEKTPPDPEEIGSERDPGNDCIT